MPPYRYVYDCVTTHTNRMRPQMWVDERQGNLVIARNPKPKPYQLPDRLIHMLGSDDRFVREGAVRILGRWLLDPDPARCALAAHFLEALNTSEQNRFVAMAIEDVQQRASATKEGAHRVRCLFFGQ